MDAAVEFGAKGVLLVGHIGKFVKLAGCIMNTHSHNADSRMELLTVHEALLGAPTELLQKMMECVTTDDALKYLKEAGLLKPVMDRIMERMEFYVNHRTQRVSSLASLPFPMYSEFWDRLPKCRIWWKKSDIKREDRQIHESGNHLFYGAWSFAR